MAKKQTDPQPEYGSAAPGPHPHESLDIRALGGDVARWADPMEGRRQADKPADDDTTV